MRFPEHESLDSPPAQYAIGTRAGRGEYSYGLWLDGIARMHGPYVVFDESGRAVASGYAPESPVWSSERAEAIVAAWLTDVPRIVAVVTWSDSAGRRIDCTPRAAELLSAIGRWPTGYAQVRHGLHAVEWTPRVFDIERVAAEFPVELALYNAGCTPVEAGCYEYTGLLWYGDGRKLTVTDDEGTPIFSGYFDGPLVTDLLMMTEAQGANWLQHWGHEYVRPKVRPG